MRTRISYITLVKTARWRERERENVVCKYCWDVIYKIGKIHFDLFFFSLSLARCVCVCCHRDKNNEKSTSEKSLSDIRSAAKKGVGKFVNSFFVLLSVESNNTQNDFCFISATIATRLTNIKILLSFDCWRRCFWCVHDTPKWIQNIFCFEKCQCFLFPFVFDEDGNAKESLFFDWMKRHGKWGECVSINPLLSHMYFRV